MHRGTEKHDGELYLFMDQLVGIRDRRLSKKEQLMKGLRLHVAVLRVRQAEAVELTWGNRGRSRTATRRETSTNHSLAEEHKEEG